MSTTENLKPQIRQWAKQLGFADVNYTNTQLDQASAHLFNWLDQGYHGDMHYMQHHATLRSDPQQLHPGTISIISVRMNYLPTDSAPPWDIINNSHQAYVSRYALGRDYHKLMRKRLQALAVKISAYIGPFGYRAFVDSAPVLEKPIAQNAGLGWIGKHTNLINRSAGSWFFLGELYTDLPLANNSTPLENHCGSCAACIDICPTDAIIAPYQLDARRCISYLTIELRGSIPIEFRKLIGNRIYGCDDCQLVCPWNKFSQPTQEADFGPRHSLDNCQLIDLFNWDESEFATRLAGSAIRRIGHLCWLRNIAVALGNAEHSRAIVQVLQTRTDHPSAMVREHVAWALQQQADKAA